MYPRVLRYPHTTHPCGHTPKFISPAFSHAYSRSSYIHSSQFRSRVTFTSCSARTPVMPTLKGCHRCIRLAPLPQCSSTPSPHSLVTFPPASLGPGPTLSPVPVGWRAWVRRALSAPLPHARTVKPGQPQLPSNPCTPSGSGTPSTLRRTLSSGSGSERVGDVGPTRPCGSAGETRRATWRRGG